MHYEKPKIGVIGAGFVGGAIARGFALQAEVKIFDKDPMRSIHSFEEVCQQDFIFLCLPTPMMHVEGGEADLSIINSVCQKLQDQGTEGSRTVPKNLPKSHNT